MLYSNNIARPVADGGGDGGGSYGDEHSWPLGLKIISVYKFVHILLCIFFRCCYIENSEYLFNTQNHG
jgi:hypothetical protein